jgi:hypothetical protein
LIELELRYQIAAALRSIWRLLMSWGFITFAAYWFYFFAKTGWLICRSTIFWVFWFSRFLNEQQDDRF